MKNPNPTADREKDPGDTQNILPVDSEKDPSRFTLNLSETNYQTASRRIQILFLDEVMQK